MQLQDMDFLLRLAAAVGSGLLIGAERERAMKGSNVVAGVRTYPMVALVGAMIVILSGFDITQSSDMTTGVGIILATGLLLGGILISIFTYLRVMAGYGGLTSVAALSVTYLCGMLTGAGIFIPAMAIAIFTTLLLYFRRRIEDLTKKMSHEQFLGAIQFIALTALIIPIVPDEPLAHTSGLLNPRRLLLLVVIFSSLSFSAYTACKLWGNERGFGLMGIFGGLVSTEATTVSLAQHSQENPNLRDSAYYGIILAGIILLFRNTVLALVADVSGDIGWVMLPSLGLMAIILLWHAIREAERLDYLSGIGTWFSHSGNSNVVHDGIIEPIEEKEGSVFGGEGATEQSEAPVLESAGETNQILATPNPFDSIQSPFRLRSGIKFAILVTLFASLALGLEHMGEQYGLSEEAILLLAFGGFVSSAAVTLSVSAYAASSGEPHIILLAGTTAVLASIISTVNRLVLLRYADKEGWKRLLVPLVSAGLIGLLGLFIPWWQNL